MGGGGLGRGLRHLRAQERGKDRNQGRRQWWQRAGGVRGGEGWWCFCGGCCRGEGGGADEGFGFGDVLTAMRRIVAATAGSQPQSTLHFVTFRNNLNKILGACYDRSESWEMGVHRRGKTVYLNVHKSKGGEREGEREGDGGNQRAERRARLEYYGYSFERFATEPFEDQRERDGEPVDANVEFCAVLKTKIGPHRVLMGAEIDCCDAPAHSSSARVHINSLVELKTAALPATKPAAEWFEREKLLKWWIQSFVAGVPSLVVGFRDPQAQARLVRVEKWTTSEIRAKVKEKGYWDPWCVIKFADQVLTWLYGSTKDGEDYTLRFSHKLSRLELLAADSCPDVITKHCELLNETRKQ